MQIILNNINKLAETNVEHLFYKFWAPHMLMYISSVYTFCLVAICLCLYCNSKKNNLIYKVLNLAVLSIFVVALWSYLTDVTFIYIVYILTFVSAVVMLFLSVVLMLPSSAVHMSKKHNSLFIFFILPTPDLTFLLLLLSFLFWVREYIFVTNYISQTNLLKVIEELVKRWKNALTSLYSRFKKVVRSFYSSSALESFYQMGLSSSTFLLALPFGNFNTKNFNFSSILQSHLLSCNNLEGLAYIQYELYVKSPILIIVCVTGLLVALIGAALLVSVKILNSR